MPKIDFFSSFPSRQYCFIFYFLLGAAEPLWSSQPSQYIYGNHGHSSQFIDRGKTYTSNLLGSGGKEFELRSSFLLLYDCLNPILNK